MSRGQGLCDMVFIDRLVSGFGFWNQFGLELPFANDVFVFFFFFFV